MSKQLVARDQQALENQASNDEDPQGLLGRNQDFLEKNGAGHLFEALKEVFYKYIERILGRAARKGRGRQDVVTRKWPPGYGHQEEAARTWPPECGHQ